MHLLLVDGTDMMFLFDYIILMETYWSRKDMVSFLNVNRCETVTTGCLEVKHTICDKYAFLIETCTTFSARKKCIICLPYKENESLYYSLKFMLLSFISFKARVMGIRRTSLHLSLLIITSCYRNVIFCFALETISPTQLVRDSGYITSSDQRFRLGFFSPGNSSNRYVGIWYNKLPGERLVVWVANREEPVTDALGVLRIHSDGNLVVLNGKQNVVWTTNVSVTASNSTAELWDSGNLVLKEASFNGSNAGRTIWQSYEHPTDTLLQDMKLVSNTKTGENQVITSWKTISDPSKGKFLLELEPLNIPQFVIWNGSQRHWRTGPWDGRVFIGVEGMFSNLKNGFDLGRDDPAGIVSIHFIYSVNFLSLTLNPTGQAQQLISVEENSGQLLQWVAPQTDCQYYGKCGSFGFCNMLSTPICSCLRGYEPKSTEEWSKGNWSSGCIRRTPLECERNTSNGGNAKGDGFLKYGKMKVPDFVDWLPVEDLDMCEQACLVNCTCTAYSFVGGIGCMSWHGDLLDIEMFPTDGVDLYIRVAYSELDKQKNFKLIIVSTVLVGLLTVSICMYLCWKLMMKRREEKKKYMKVLVLGKNNSVKDFPYSDEFDAELPSFEYEKLAVATDYFSLENKLGEGGFGSVYKGKFANGQEVAIKRLSESSGQGTEEFKNEVVVISGLQHRNLVRLLGCCIEGEEKMLIYEYMPNTSLDAFLFDPLKKGLLAWDTRFQIIVGIGRGILYLHRDSRLKVIHRDLKPSNILLDKDLNPKISDFGMARIFGGDVLQAKTRRVVGTYGYMSPEYAMRGNFSEKSDVYSFGVLLLEIVTGLRNTGFHHHEESSSLIQHVWKLWQKGETQVLIDCTISEPSSYGEMSRCIHVGLLCVQDFAEDRPTMQSVVSMLTSEISSLPTPNQPAFTGRQGSSDSNLIHGNSKNGSINNVSITTLGGR